MIKKFRRAGSIIFALVLSLSMLLAGFVFAAEATPEKAQDEAVLEEQSASEETTEEETTTPEQTTTEEPASTTEPETTNEAVTEQSSEQTSEQTSEQPSSEEQTSEDETEDATDESEETSTGEETTTEKSSVKETTTSEKNTQSGQKNTTTSTEKATEKKTTEKQTTESQTTDDKQNDGTTHVDSTGQDSYRDIGTVFGKPEKYGTLYWPLPREYGLNSISSRYGYRTGQYSGMHRGLDIAAPQGTPIYACADGVVVASYFSDSAGNFTVIKHDDGIYTEYMHQSVRHVKTGDTVKAGQVIGLVGTTGWSTGPHLHIGVVISDTGYDIAKRVDPLPYLTFAENLDDLAAPVEIKEEDLLIEYKDGKGIAETISEKPEIISSLYPIFSASKIKKTSFSGFTYKGYVGEKGDKIKEKNAISIAIPSGFSKHEDRWVRYEADDYDIVLNIAATYNSSEKEVPLTFKLDSPIFGMDWSSYRKSDLKETYYTEIAEKEGGYYALDIHVDIFKHGTDERIDLPEIYQIVDGVDKAQTFRSVNESYSDKALFVKNKKLFEKNYNKNDEKSFITKDGDIYSGFSLDPFKEFDSKGQADLYRQTEAIKQDGLDLVYGFEHKSSAGLNFYAPKEVVSYKVTEGGKVSKSGEIVLKGDVIKADVKPVAEAGYEFVEWITDQDITLGDESKIEAGKAVSVEDIKSVTVLDSLSFTARFEKKADTAEEDTSVEVQTSEEESKAETIETESTTEISENESSSK